MIGQDDDAVIELPQSNFSISLFKDTKTLLFTPQEHKSLTNKIRTFVQMLKQQYDVDTVKEKEAGIFEVVFDPTVNFDEIVDFIKQELKQDENL